MPEWRQQEPGVSIPGWWHEETYPHVTEWHFATALNISNCRSAGGSLPGDHLYVFSRLRLQSECGGGAARLAGERDAASRVASPRGALYSNHPISPPPGRLLAACIAPATPVNFGDWCAKGAQPIWSLTSNEHSGLIPFIQWVQRPDRDTDLSYFDPAHADPEMWDFGEYHITRQGSTPCHPNRVGDSNFRNCSDWCRASEAVDHCAQCSCAQCPFCWAHLWQHKQRVAVFRGAAHRLSAYSTDWRKQGPRRTPITSKNWQSTGRTALIAQKDALGDRLNIFVANGCATNHSHRLKRFLQIDNTTWMNMDMPSRMSFSDQVDRFKYTINAEGHGGWADRLYKSMLLGQLVIMPDLPARLWYEAPLRPWVHYIPVTADLRNLSSAIRWARNHDDDARRIALAAQETLTRWLAPAAMFRYTEELLSGYAQVFNSSEVQKHPRRVRFTCTDPELSEKYRCKPTLAEGRSDIELKGTHCFFELPSESKPLGANREKYASVFEASLYMLDRSEGEEPGAQEDGCLAYGGHSPAVLQVIAGNETHNKLLSEALWMQGLEKVRRSEFWHTTADADDR
eukprot:scaffold37611_cov35-Tisochrysis_lutea.AAC.4